MEKLEFLEEWQSHVEGWEVLSSDGFLCVLGGTEFPEACLRRCWTPGCCQLSVLWNVLCEFGVAPGGAQLYEIADFQERGQMVPV